MVVAEGRRAARESRPGRQRRATAVTGAVLLALVAVPGTASAADAPAPSSGPASGTTIVTGTVDPAPAFATVDGTWDFFAALGADGRAYTWGDNFYGQLGTGDTVERTSPSPVTWPSGATATAVVAGDYHAVALATDGRTYAWGSNSNGQLGDGSAVNASTPTTVALPAGVTLTQVSAGGFHTVGLGSDGRTYAWGRNGQGQLGDPGTPPFDQDAPVVTPVPAGATFTRVEAGNLHTVALTSDGRLYAWGSNSSGQLGDGTTTSRNAPTLVTEPAPGVTYTSVSAGHAHTVATGSDGRTYAWGENSHGELGVGDTTDRTTPVAVHVPAGVTFSRLSAGQATSAAVGSDGRAYLWGLNDDGELGLGDTTVRREPEAARLPAGVSADAVTAGRRRSVVLASDGNAYAWGNNGRGQLGDGTTTSSLVPVTVLRQTLDGVDFDGVPGTGVTFDPGTGAWSVRTPATGCGPVDVVVHRSVLGRSVDDTYPGGFTYGTVPAVLSQPADAQVPAGGGTYTGTVTVGGDPAPAVQWQRQDASGAWQDVPGATAPQLSLPVAGDTSVRALLTSCAGSATSRTARVTVATAPALPVPTSPPSVPGGTGPDTDQPSSSATTGRGSGGDGLAWTGSAPVRELAALAVALCAGGAVLVAGRLRRR